jgi:hypothetical protein
MTSRFDGYDFLDFGCSGGGSIIYVTRIFPGVRGLGLDVDPRKVAKAKEAGFDAEVCDVASLTAAPDQVRFVVMSHFLEHLTGRKPAFDCLLAAARVATEFVVIRQPWFDADGYLFGLGLKFYWSHWRGHRYHMTALEMQQCMEALASQGAIEQYALFGRKPVRDSGDPSVHPLASPVDQHEWDKTVHPPKPSVAFGIPIYRELCAVAVRNGGQIDELARRFKFDQPIFRSRR